MTDEIKFVKNGTVEAFIHDLKFKASRIQRERVKDNVIYTLFGDYIYVYEPRLWYKPFYWILSKIHLAFEGAILKS